MTKDRRLGRGLAALLGTPVDEEGNPLPDDSHGLESSSPFESPSAVATASPTTRKSGKTVPTRKVTKSNTDPDLDVGLTESRAKKIASLHEQSGTTHTPEVKPSETRSVKIPVASVENNPFQPRRQFNESEIASLAESLREHEQLQPIIVRRIGSGYQLVSGERRLRAARHAGLETIRADVRDVDDRMTAELAIIENLQRKDLNAVEKALSFKRYIREHDCKQEDLAKRLKIDRTTVTNMMRLLDLPEQILDAVQSDKIAAGHARAMLPLETEEQQLDFAKQCETEGWSVRETERRVAEALSDADGGSPTGAAKKKSKAPKSDQMAALEQDLKMALGTKVEIKSGTRGKGKITIHFSNAMEFERLRDSLAAQNTANRAA